MVKLKKEKTIICVKSNQKFLEKRFHTHIAHLHSIYSMINQQGLSSHRPMNVVIVIVFFENDCGLLEAWFLSRESFSKKYPGGFGWGSSRSSLNMRTTDDMSGRSIGYCCTYKRPIFMQRNSSCRLLDESFKCTSIRSNGLPSFSNAHA